MGRSHLRFSFLRLPDRAGLVLRLPAFAGMALIRAYQLTLSGLIGRQCRHLPSCSAYTSESIGRFGLWAGGWMGLARICRCNPWGTHGLDFPPSQSPARARWWAPWRYGRWRGVQDGVEHAVVEQDGVGNDGAGLARADMNGAGMGRSGGEGKRSGFRCD